MLSPIYHNLVKHFKAEADILFALYDVTLNDLPIGLYSAETPKGYPVVMFFGKNQKTSPHVYNGPLWLDDLINFVNTHRQADA